MKIKGIHKHFLYSSKTERKIFNEFINNFLDGNNKSKIKLFIDKNNEEIDVFLNNKNKKDHFLYECKNIDYKYKKELYCHIDKLNKYKNNLLKNNKKVCLKIEFFKRNFCLITYYKNRNSNIEIIDKLDDFSKNLYIELLEDYCDEFDFENVGILNMAINKIPHIKNSIIKSLNNNSIVLNKFDIEILNYLYIKLNSIYVYRYENIYKRCIKDHSLSWSINNSIEYNFPLINKIMEIDNKKERKLFTLTKDLDKNEAIEIYDRYVNVNNIYLSDIIYSAIEEEYE